MSARYEKVLELVEKLSITDKKLNEDELTSILTKTYDLCRVPPLQNPNVCYSAADFKSVAGEAELQLSIILKLLDVVILARSEHRQQFSHAFLRNTVVTCLLAACEYCDDIYEWSNQEAANVSKRIIDKLCELCDCKDVTEILSNSRDESSRRESGDKNYIVKVTHQNFIKPVLGKLSEMLTKANWRTYPSIKMSYCWILKRIGKDDLGDHLVYLLPPALLIIDDWENKHKLLGLQCLHHILDNTVASELRWYGRAAVIYDAMKPLLYTRESEVLHSLYPGIIKVAKILEADPANTGKLFHDSLLDFIMQQLLQEMAYEQKLCLRSVYAAALPLIVMAMELPAVIWSKQLMDVCGDYLATFEGAEAQDRINILKALQNYVKMCWPQVHIHASSLLKMVVRLLYDVTEEGSGVDAESVEIITEEAQTLIKLLHGAAPNTVGELCQGLKDVVVHQECQLLLQNIHATIQEDS